MIVKRTIRYRLHTGSRAKYSQLYGLAGACRFAWNHFVGKLQDDYCVFGHCEFNHFTLSKKFRNLRNHTRKWLQDYSANIVFNSLKPIETTYSKFFKDDGGLPKFKGKYSTDPSFPIQFGMTAKLDGDWLHIQKIGYVRLIGNNPYSDGIPKSGTVKEENGKWYAYIVYDVETADDPHSFRRVVGLDRNVGNIALSDGRMFKTPDVSKKERRRTKYQRMMARRQKPNKKQGVKPSNRYLKARKQYRRISGKIRKINDNWIHHVSKEIASDYDVVYIENLNTKGMTRSAKGTFERPGRNVKAKSGLNKAILKAGWYKLEQVLSYKAANVTKVPAHYTSQTCNKCGNSCRDNRTTQARFKCLTCGHSDNADINAAKNILALGSGERLNGRGEETGKLSASTMKRPKCDDRLSSLVG